MHSFLLRCRLSIIEFCLFLSTVFTQLPHLQVRLLARPRGVQHLASLIKKGAFSSAVDVMEPTQAAATACMSVVGCAIEVTKVSDRSMALANNLGFFKAADKVTVEGRAALETAATAASVNEAAVRAMGRLNSLGDLARDDDEVLTRASN